MKLNKKWAIIIGVLILLMVARISLPYFVTRHVNKTLDDIEGYYGSISGVNISLIRGAYKVRRLTINKEDSKLEVPFVSVNEIDLSVEWRALFKGNIVGEILLLEPKVNFVQGPDEEEMDGSEADWTEPLKELMPIQINKFEIRNGNIHFYNFSSEPEVNLFLKNLHLVAENLSNVEDKNDRLPSSISLKASSIGEGKLDISARMNVLKAIPEFDMNFKFTDVQLQSLNEFFETYGNFTVNKGHMHIISEAKLLDGQFEGYVKPLLRNVEVLDLEEDIDKKSFPRILWEGLIELGKQIFENPEKEQVATVVPIEGNIEDVETEPWAAIYNILKNAFVEAFTTEFESIQDS